MRKQAQAIFLLLCGMVLLNAQTPVQGLKNVKAVYVSLEGQNASVGEMLRAKIIAQLTKIQGLSVVEEETDADAILTGSGLVQSGVNEYGRTRYRIQGGMRLISKEGGRVLWADDISSSRYARSASSSFAENLAKKLGQAFADSQKK
jgi:hypothetical protein